MKLTPCQYLAALPVLLCLTLCVSCHKEEWVNGLQGVAFSCEAVSFDTVFTHCGTTTRQLKIYNRGNDDIRIESVTLTGLLRHGHSCFRLNVDGDTALTAHNIEIASGDSCFVFVQATIDPNSASALFVETDTLLLRSGGDQRKLPLQACGRNAIYHLPKDTLQLADGSYPTDNFGNHYSYSVIDCAGWRHDLPHVIVGYAVVDANNTLNLTAGDELYFHNDAVLWVYDSATLHVEGSATQPVRFTSLRHDGWYDFLPGQWGYIWLSSGSRDNVIRHAVIENGTVGILADTNAGGNPTLTVECCEIRRQSMAGIIGQTAYIVGRNLLVHTCGVATVALQYGGRYELEHCTLANYWSYGGRDNASVIVNNHLTHNGIEYLYALPLARFSNSIVYGNRAAGEMLLDLDERIEAHIEIDNTIVRGGDWDVDPCFTDPYGGDYRLNDGSPAAGLGYLFDNQNGLHGAGTVHAVRRPLSKLTPPKKIQLRP
ncbi:MAG: hypothetical protein AUK63_1326 [bacterium P3]|nr:MAG: hypothetical protein AUK63_1326 [bacterium P3]KWW40434.1 MAG: hypothetical protein F083_1671 [bacterium F083]